MTRLRLLLVGSLVTIFVVGTLSWYSFFSRGNFIVWDIHPIFVSARIVLRGENPYAPEVTQLIQQEMYGRPARADEDNEAFAYPLIVAYLAIPFALMPIAWARAIWMALLLVGILAAIGLIINIWHWPRRPIVFGLVILWTIFFYPIVWGYALGQITLMIFVVLTLAVWAILGDHDWLAGVSLGVLVIKPQLAVLILPGLLIWAIAQRRWRIVIGTAGTIGFLIGVPTLFQLGWPVAFVNRVFEYNAAQPFLAPAIVAVNRCCAPVAAWLAPSVVIAMVGLMMFGWWEAVRTRTDGDLMWAIGFTLLGTTLISPQISTVNQVILLIPIYGQLKVLFSKGVPGILTAIALMAVWAVGLWILSLTPPVSTARPRYPVEHQILSPILPITLGVAWIMSRTALRRLQMKSS